MKTKKALVILACGIVGFALPFLFFGFAKFNFDFVQWGEKARSGVMFISLLLSVFCACGGKLFITDEF